MGSSGAADVAATADTVPTLRAYPAARRLVGVSPNLAGVRGSYRLGQIARVDTRFHDVGFDFAGRQLVNAT
jgi:hypothetical protein